MVEVLCATVATIAGFHTWFTGTRHYGPGGVFLGWTPAESATPTQEACCELHQSEGCCDPDDCGPCCENCPTCPTLARWATPNE
jgi:hypothetical protein